MATSKRKRKSSKQTIETASSSPSRPSSTATSVGPTPEPQSLSKIIILKLSPQDNNTETSSKETPGTIKETPNKPIKRKRRKPAVTATNETPTSKEVEDGHTTANQPLSSSIVILLMKDEKKFQYGDPEIKPRKWTRQKITFTTVTGAILTLPFYITTEPPNIKEPMHIIQQQQSVPIDPARPVSCTFPQCTKSFIDEPSMKKHYTLAHEARGYICRMEGCTMQGIKFQDRLSLTRHQMEVHGSRNYIQNTAGSTEEKTTVEEKPTIEEKQDPE